MAKLFETTMILRNRLITRFKPVSTLYLNVINVRDVVSVEYTDNDGNQAIGSQINYWGFDGTFLDEITVTEAPSTINTRMNAANTTDVHKIDLTFIDPFAPATGYVAQSFKSVRGVNVENIWQVMVNSANSSNATVWIGNPTHSNIEQSRVEETASAIATAANA